MKIKILKTFRQDHLWYPKNTILDLHDWGGRWYVWSDEKLGCYEIVVWKQFIDDRIAKGIIQVI